MEDKTIIGIDPGSKGFITLRRGEHLEFFSIAEHHIVETAAYLRRAREESADIVVAMEEVHAIFGSSAGATFTFGETFGILQGFLMALRIPYHLVPPKEWQAEIWVKDDRRYLSGRRVNTKATSLNAARRLFPDIDLRRNANCTKPDDNKADSLLICEYARRKNL